MTSDDVLALLRERFKPPESVLVAELANATGFACNRHADAVAFGCWPSTGLEIQGFEIKVARSDWLRELKNLEKHAAIARYCDRWWIVAPPDVVAKDEVPVGWGYMLATDKLVAKKPAPQLEAEPITRKFLAAVLRNAVSTIAMPGEHALQEAKSAGYRKGLEDGLRDGRSENPHALYDDLKAKVARFEETAGIEIAGDHGVRGAGGALRALVELRKKTRYEGLRTYRDSLEELLRLSDAAIAAVGPHVEGKP